MTLQLCRHPILVIFLLFAFVWNQNTVNSYDRKILIQTHYEEKIKDALGILMDEDLFSISVSVDLGLKLNNSSKTHSRGLANRGPVSDLWAPSTKRGGHPDEELNEIKRIEVNVVLDDQIATGSVKTRIESIIKTLIPETRSCPDCIGIKTAESTNSTGNKKFSKAKDFSKDIQHDQITHVHNDHNVVIEGDALTEILSGQHFTEAEQKITLATPGGSIEILPGEILINGTQVTFNSGGANSATPFIAPPKIPEDDYLASPVKEEKPQDKLLSIKVAPKWRKWLEGNAKTSDLSSLLRLPQGDAQQKIIDNILKKYTPETFDAAQSMVVPKTMTSWVENVKDPAGLEKTVTAELQLDKADRLPHGWIYVFAKCKGGPNPLYQKIHLHKEYILILKNLMLEFL